MNPLRVAAQGAIHLKAGASARVSVNLGSDLLLALPNPASYLRAASIPLNGSSSHTQSVSFVLLRPMQYPQGWSLQFAGATLSLRASSSSQNQDGYTINTRTQVFPEQLELDLQIAVPASASPGTYALRAMAITNYGSSASLALDVSVER